MRMDADANEDLEALEALKRLGGENEEEIAYAATEEPEGPEYRLCRSSSAVHYSPINRYQTSYRARAEAARNRRTNNLRAYARRRGR